MGSLRFEEIIERRRSTKELEYHRNASVRFLGQVSSDEIVKEFLAGAHFAFQEGAIVRELDFVKTDDGERRLTKFRLELFAERQFVGVELIVAIEQGQFDRDFNHVLDDFFSFAFDVDFAQGEHLKGVEQSALVFVYKRLRHLFRRHLA